MSKSAMQLLAEMEEKEIIASEVPKDAMFKVVPMKRFESSTGEIKEFVHLYACFEVEKKRWFKKPVKEEVEKLIRAGGRYLEFPTEKEAKKWIANFRKFHEVEPKK